MAAGGCSGEEHPGAHVSSRPRVSTTPTPTPTPTPTTLTLAQARVRYLRIVAQPNVDYDYINNKLVGHAQSLTTYRRWGRRLQRDLHAEAVALRLTQWPAAVRPVATRMADAEAAVIADLQGMAAATDNNSAVDSWDSAATDAVKSAHLGEQIRELLGLPAA